MSILGFTIALAVLALVSYALYAIYKSTNEKRIAELAVKEATLKRRLEEREAQVAKAYEAKRTPSRSAPVTVPSSSASKPVVGGWKEPAPSPDRTTDIAMAAILLDSYSTPTYTEPTRTESYSSCSSDYGSSSSSSYDSSSSSSCDSSSSY